MENKRMGKRGVLLLLPVAILIVGIVVVLTVGGTPVGIARATEEGGLLTFTAPAGTVTLTPRGEGGLAWDGLLGENGWTEVNFSILP